MAKEKPQNASRTNAETLSGIIHPEKHVCKLFLGGRWKVFPLSVLPHSQLVYQTNRADYRTAKICWSPTEKGLFPLFLKFLQRSQLPTLLQPSKTEGRLGMWGDSKVCFVYIQGDWSNIPSANLSC